MNELDPIAKWLEDLRVNPRHADRELLQKYFRRVEELARKRLGPSAPGSVGPDDIAQSVFRTFLRRIQNGEFMWLKDDNDICRLLTTITLRKAYKQLRRPRWTVSDFIDQAARNPPPETDAIIGEEVDRLNGLLDKNARSILKLLIDGYSHSEIATRCGVSIATVERRRHLIKLTFERENQT